MTPLARLLLPLGALRGARRGAALPLPPAAAHKLRHVLRAREGAEVLAFDGCSGEWRCAVGPNCASLVAACREREQEPAAGAGCSAPLLAFAPLRPERTRSLVEKATELGVGALLPVASALGQRVAAGGGGLCTPSWPAKAAEWAAGAAEQCGRLSLPRAAAPAPVALAELLWAWRGGGGGGCGAEAAAALLRLPARGFAGGGGPAAGEGGSLAAAGARLAAALQPAGGLLLVADAASGAGALPTVAAAVRDWGGGVGAPTAVLVGPEGGWSPAERAAFAAVEEAGGGAAALRRVTLGPLVLRADTAAAAALALLAAARQA